MARAVPTAGPIAVRATRLEPVAVRRGLRCLEGLARKLPNANRLKSLYPSIQ